MTSLLNKEIGMSQINVGRVVGSRIYTEEKPDSPLDGDIFIDTDCKLYVYKAETGDWEYYITIKGEQGTSITGLELKEASDSIYALYYYLSDGTEGLAGYITVGSLTNYVYDSQGIQGSYDASNNTAYINGVGYHLDTHNTCSITDFISDECNGNVVLDWISVFGTTYTVTAIGSRAFYNTTTLMSVVIGDSVTSIGDYAFYSCSSLESVVIGDSVTSIGDYAFYNCSSLGDVDMPSVTSIGAYAFHSCSSLGDVDMPSVTSIGDRAFHSCSSLGDVDMPSVTSIGYGAFASANANNMYIGKPSDVTSSSSVTLRSDSVGGMARIGYGENFVGCVIDNLYFYKRVVTASANHTYTLGTVHNLFLLNTASSSAQLTNFKAMYTTEGTLNLNSTYSYPTHVQTIYIARSNPSLGNYAFNPDFNETYIDSSGYTHTVHATDSLYRVHYAGTSLTLGTGGLPSNAQQVSGWDGKTLYDYSTDEVIGELVDGKAVWYDDEP